jgi:PKD repeat protein
MNNTEGVFLGPTASGDFIVRVIASNINSDGIFNQGDDTDQDFALVCYNCVGGADFALSAGPDDLEVCAPEIVTSTIRVGEIVGVYSCPVTLEVVNVPAGVTAEITPTVVIPTGEAVLTLDVDADTADGEYTLIVSGTAEITNVHTAEISLTVGSAPLVASLQSDPGVLGLPVHFTATLAAGTSPLTYTWDCGGPGCGTGLDTATPVYTYSIPGTFTVVLTVENKYGSDIISDTVMVCQPVEDVTVNGPGNLLTKEVGFYTAICTPTIATLPVALTWDNGTVGPTATYSWTVPGTYTLIVTATNFCLDTCVVTETMNVVVADRLYPIYLPLVMGSCHY